MFLNVFLWRGTSVQNFHLFLNEIKDFFAGKISKMIVGNMLRKVEAFFMYTISFKASILFPDFWKNLLKIY